MFLSMFLRKPRDRKKTDADADIIDPDADVCSFAQTVLESLKQRNDDLAQAIESETEEHADMVEELRTLSDQVEDMAELLDAHRSTLADVASELQAALNKYSK